MKRIAIWTLVICMLLLTAACGSKPTPANQPDAATTDAPLPADPETPDTPEAAFTPGAYKIVRYEVGSVAYEGQQLVEAALDSASFTLNADHTGTLVLTDDDEMEIGWTDKGEVTVAGIPMYTLEKIDANTVKLTMMETAFTFRMEGVEPTGEEETPEPAVEATDAPAPENTDEPAATDAGGEVTLEGKIGFGPTKVPVTVTLPQSGWCATAPSSTVYFYNVPDPDKAYSDTPRVSAEFKESLEKINFYLDSFENLQELEPRTIGGIEMTGRSYKNVGMDWVEYYGEIAEGVWVSVKLSGVDYSAGTEADAILNSMVFGTPHE